MINQNKMTAVEYLEAIIKHCERFGTLIEQIDIEQAKAMEKEQITDAYLNGRYEADIIVMGHNFYSEQYYNETFKSE